MVALSHFKDETRPHLLIALINRKQHVVENTSLNMAFVHPRARVSIPDLFLQKHRIHGIESGPLLEAFYLRLVNDCFRYLFLIRETLFPFLCSTIQSEKKSERCPYTLAKFWHLKGVLHYAETGSLPVRSGAISSTERRNDGGSRS